MSKIHKNIVRIELNEASYKDSGAYIEPTYVNFFFGNNGTGKSTIAKAIQSGVNVTYSAGTTASDYLPLVFNQAFIDDNVKKYRGMDGVFTLNAKNDLIQQQIDEQTELRKKTNEAKSKDNEALAKKIDAKEQLRKDFYKSCWDKEKAFREEFSKTQNGKMRSEPFMREVLAHSPVDKDMEEFRRLYDSAFSDTAKRYSRFNEIPNTHILDTVADADILSVSIVNSSETKLAKTLQEIGSTEWMRQGHEEYANKADGRCPYCGRDLETNFEELFIASFDEKYQKNLERLDSFLSTYRDTANSLFVPLSTLPTEVYPSIDTKSYTDKLEVLKALIQENIETIKSKKESPALTVSLKNTETVITELSEIINDYNKLIDENNAVVDAGPKKQKECTGDAFDILSFRLSDAIATYNTSDAALDKEINNLQTAINGYDTTLSSIKSELARLRKQTVETDTAKDSINKMLHDSGMRGFSLVPKKGVEHVYEVQRPNGEIADNLSEGEKNFIAFLYFYHLVHGSTSENGETREKIVVIDDPVSSMDSGALFIVSSLVRRMIEICRNNADNRNSLVKGNFIKQIFILTHNAYFHREITYGYLDKYEYVSFYLIRKFGTKSSIKMTDMVNPNEPTTRINVNPVKNSYAALWDEYIEVKSAVPLMNVIRRILEFYFLQLCGYEGITLRDRILIEGKANGRFTNADGTENEEAFQMAAAMLSYINSSTVGMTDGMDFVEDCLDADECRNVFEMIFEEMGQKQHFDMMLRKK